MGSALYTPEEVVKRGFVQDYSPDLVQPNSLDLRLAEVYQIKGSLSLSSDGTRSLPSYEEKRFKETAKGSWITLHPGEVYQVEFQESVTFDHTICGITLLRSSMFKSGASGESGLFDSGYSGRTGMVITTRKQVHLEWGAPVAQMLFFRVEASRLYDGYYQDSQFTEILKGGVE